MRILGVAGPGPNSLRIAQGEARNLYPVGAEIKLKPEEVYVLYDGNTASLRCICVLRQSKPATAFEDCTPSEWVPTECPV